MAKNGGSWPAPPGCGVGLDSSHHTVLGGRFCGPGHEEHAMPPYLKWLLMLVVALVVTAIMIDSIDESRFLAGRRSTPERAHERAPGDVETKLQVELSQLVRRDSLLPLLPSSGLPVYRGHPDLKLITGRRPLDSLVNTELRTLTEPRARIGVFVVDKAYGLHRSTATPPHD